MLNNRLLVGAMAGLIATGPMTLVMKFIQQLTPRWERQSLPPKELTQKVSRRVGVQDPSQQEVLFGLAHFGFGGVAGAVYAVSVARLPLPVAVRSIPFALGLWFVCYQAGWPALGLLPPAHRQPVSRNALLIVSHIVWGATLGWLVEVLKQPNK